jgi:glucuronyl/N-acetylglucosaminyl transferase EXT1
LLAVLAVIGAAAGGLLAASTLWKRAHRRHGGGPPKKPKVWRNYLSPFEPSCLRTTRANQCPGYMECVAEMSSTSWLPPNPVNVRPPAPPVCSKENCLNRSRCHPPFRVFAYSKDNVPEALRPCFKSTLLSRLPNRSKHLVTDDPARACVFWVELDQIRNGVCKFDRLKELPHWNASSGGLPNGDGLNHIVFDERITLITPAFRRQFLGRAALAVTAAWTEKIVYGFDIAVGQGQQRYDAATTEALLALPPWQRKWLAAFKGSQTHPSRRTLATQHDERAGFVALSLSESFHSSCKTLPPKIKGKTGLVRAAAAGTVQERAKEKGVSLLEADCCDKWRTAYEQYDYKDVQNTTFGLILPGHSAATFRLTEMLRMGTIPVFVAIEQYWLPYGHAPHWEDAALFVPTAVDVHADLLPKLRALRDDHAKVLQMQRAAVRIYHEWFAGRQDEPMRAAVLEVLRRRFEYEGDE